MGGQSTHFGWVGPPHNIETKGKLNWLFGWVGRLVSQFLQKIIPLCGSILQADSQLSWESMMEPSVAKSLKVRNWQNYDIKLLLQYIYKYFFKNRILATKKTRPQYYQFGPNYSNFVLTIFFYFFFNSQNFY